jgi:hypothetical protein
MVLVDTSVWVHHFRNDEPRLRHLLEHGQVLVHPFVVGELACGRLRDRAEVLDLLGRLDPAARASDDEAMELVEAKGLMGAGIGWVDVHLVASCLLSRARLWTNDKALSRVANRLGLTLN